MAPVHEFGRPFLLRLAAGSFAVGACMELFMIKTGFYDKVTVIESQRREDAKTAEPPLLIQALQRDAEARRQKEQ